MLLAVQLGYVYGVLATSFCFLVFIILSLVFEGPF